MPRITLPDGSVKAYDQPVFAFQVAQDIGPGLAKAALGCKIDGVLSDIGSLIASDCELSIVTAKTRDGALDDDALYLMRHSCAHVMAEAVQRVVPGVLLVYGPPVENGFYYDMYVPEDRPISSADFEAIEKEMAAIAGEDRPFARYDRPVAEGVEKLKDEGSKYKLDNAQRAIEAGSAELSWYTTGEPGKDWEDLCRGPHVPTTGRIGAFKVMSVASSYWHGDADSDRLTRLYGITFPDKKQLDEHLVRLEEAKKRDHRVLGKQLKLFYIDEAVGQGLVLWAPNGTIVRRELEAFILSELIRQGYQQVCTPHIGKLGLYKTSGHFPYYQNSQYPPLIHQEQMRVLVRDGCSCAELANLLREGDIDGYLLKPMNCPHHIKLFDSEPHSYRDLPVRLAEFGMVYRWEQSGEVGGLTRVRGFTQDDAHIFCTEDQVEQELMGCLELVNIIFNTLEMKDYRVRVGLRDKDSSKYVGEMENWDRAEAACVAAAESLGVPFKKEIGEAAFYGPKVDFIVKDVLGRDWQLGTVQVDYNLPERFDLSYIGADNQQHRPVMIHRAPFGSIERFVGVLIEHFAGAFPTWLSPEQVRVLPVSDKFLDYGKEVCDLLKAHGRRASLDDSSERVQAKIRAAQEMQVPYMLIVGGRDRDARTVSVRHRREGDVGAMPLDAFVEALDDEVRSKGEATVLEKLQVPA
ncbi:MAG: threonine--tRNA ligase [Phycisphaerales bacterium]|nr:threonine--tRNA ligase [Phycisphaerales bacterium]